MVRDLESGSESESDLKPQNGALDPVCARSLRGPVLVCAPYPLTPSISFFPAAL